MGMHSGWKPFAAPAPKIIDGHCEILPADCGQPAAGHRISPFAEPVKSVVAKSPFRFSRVVVAIDATTSRYWYWETARFLQDCLLAQLPASAIALAVYAHGLDTFTPFIAERNWLRARAARIRCDGGRECLPDVLRHTAKLRNVDIVVNVSDGSAACDVTACQYADRLRAQGTRVIILSDPVAKCDYGQPAQKIYAWIAARTGGALLPFDAPSLTALLHHVNHGIAFR